MYNLLIRTGRNDRLYKTTWLNAIFLARTLSKDFEPTKRNAHDRFSIGTAKCRTVRRDRENRVLSGFRDK